MRTSRYQIQTILSILAAVSASIGNVQAHNTNDHNPSINHFDNLQNFGAKQGSYQRPMVKGRVSHNVIVPSLSGRDFSDQKYAMMLDGKPVVDTAPGEDNGLTVINSDSANFWPDIQVAANMAGAPSVDDDGTYVAYDAPPTPEVTPGSEPLDSYSQEVDSYTQDVYDPTANTNSVTTMDDLLVEPSEDQ